MAIKSRMRLLGFLFVLIMALVALSLAFSRLAVSQAGPTPIDPLTIPKYTEQLPIPPTFEPTVVVDGTSPSGFRHDYTISMEETTQQMLPTGYPATPIFAYTGTVTGGGTYSATPSANIEALRDTPVRVDWINNLNNSFLPVDPTLTWPDPNGMGPQSPVFPPFPPGFPLAQSPVPASPTLHGGEVDSYSAGGPNAWFTNNGIYGSALTPGINYTAPNTATHNYANGQMASMMWFHDQTIGMSRLNTQSGLQGMYLLRDPADTIEPILPGGAYEIPLAIQDASFNTDGSIAYPLGGPNAGVHPYWSPEYYGETIMVNGKVWPNLNVDPAMYRFRIVNSSNSRFYTLTLSNGGQMVLIGNDGGYMPNPVVTTALTVAPGERADVLIDFSAQTAGTQIILQNGAPTPFPLGPLFPNPDTNGQVMRFTVSGATPVPPPTIPFILNNIPTLTPNAPMRTMTINEAVSAQTGGSLGIYLNGQPFSGAITETPAVGATEEWEIINMSANTHTLHLPLAKFKLVREEAFDAIGYNAAWYLANGVDPTLGLQGPLPGPAVNIPATPYLLPPFEAPLPEQLGWKDTLMINPAEVTRIRVRFAPQDAVGAAPNVNMYPFDPTLGPGYAWYSSMMEDADNQMVRPLTVTCASANCNVPPSLAINQTVSSSGGIYANPGDTLTYDVTVTNNGAGVAQNVTLTYPGPNNTSAPAPPSPAALGNIAGGGGTATHSYTVTVDNPLPVPVPANISSTITVAADNNVPVSTTTAISTAQLPPQLGMSKTVDDANGDGIAQPGEVLTYTLVVTNTGLGTAQNVVITDPGPNNTSAPNPAGPYSLGDIGTVANTASVVYTVTVNNNIPTTVAAITNNAVATADNFGVVEARSSIRNAVSDMTPLSPLAIPKYTEQMPIPPTYQTTVVADPSSPTGFRHDYDVSMERFPQQILPIGFPKTEVFGYSGLVQGGGPTPFRFSPGATFEASRNTPVKVNWTNNIQEQMLPVDPTLHWADPNNIGPIAPPFDAFPPGFPSAQAPVPTSVHLHGAEVRSDSDGHPDAWFTYNGLTGGGVNMDNYTAPNTLTTTYPNGQQATTLWYHDHALGITRINVLSGLAGFYLLRDPADTIEPSLPNGAQEIPIVIQDRSFNTDGSFSFDTEGVNPATHPYWTPEFIGDTIMVNGKVWPNLDVEPRQYRFRVLNGSNSRFYTLQLDNGMPFTQVGSDGGYLPHPLTQTALTLAPAERADIVVDFSGVPAGTQIIMTNAAPAPFPLGALPDPDTTGQVMRFTVTGDPPVAPTALPWNMNTMPKLTPDSPGRILTLNEVMNLTTGAPMMALLNGQKWGAAASELPAVGSTEIWDIANLTGDTHPIHLHLVQFQVVERIPFNSFAYDHNWLVANGQDPTMGLMGPLTGPTVDVPLNNFLLPPGTPPAPSESGWKDTVQAPPGFVTRIKVRYAPQDAAGTVPYQEYFPFDSTFGPGYVWHCHILDHEDNEMMRPLVLDGDTQGPTVSNVTPSGWVKNSSPTVEADLADTESGIDTASATISLDGGGPLAGCTVTSGHISCPASGLGEGNHTILVSVDDNAGNNGTGSGSFDVDSIQPSISNVSPSGWRNSSSATIEADFSDGGSGINTAAASLSLDGGGPLAGCTVTSGHISCPASGLGDGHHTIAVSVGDNAGNTGTGSGSFDIDTVAPVISNTMPTGNIADNSVTISADYSDAASGISLPPSTVSLLVDLVNVTSQATVTNSGVSYSPAGLMSDGNHVMILAVSDVAGNITTVYWNFNVGYNSSYFTWYDGINASNWVLMANPASSLKDDWFNLYIAGNQRSLPSLTGLLPGQVPPGKVLFSSYADMGGPVEVRYNSASKAITSERTLWAGNSIEEVLGSDAARLSDHFYWTWYDAKTPGFQNWVLASNPSKTETVHAVVTFTDAISGLPVMAESDIAPGKNWISTFPGNIGGPVELKAYLAGGAWPADARNVLASQRVLSNYGTAFNEMPGIPADELTDSYVWSWYDMATPGFSNWVLIANPDPSNPVTYEVKVDGFVQPCPAGGCNIPAGGMVTPVFPGLKGGPVEVTASGNVIATQRVLAGPSFGETPGFDSTALTDTYHWTWYDMKSPQSTNWVLISNDNLFPVTYEVKIGDVVQPCPTGGCIIPANRIVTPTFPGVIGGPVTVTASGPVMVSQRVLWSGFFNEVLGTVIN